MKTDWTIKHYSNTYKYLINMAVVLSKKSIVLHIMIYIKSNVALIYSLSISIPSCFDRQLSPPWLVLMDLCWQKHRNVKNISSKLRKKYQNGEKRKKKHTILQEIQQQMKKRKCIKIWKMQHVLFFDTIYFFVLCSCFLLNFLQYFIIFMIFSPLGDNFSQLGIFSGGCVYLVCFGMVEWHRLWKSSEYASDCV